MPTVEIRPITLPRDAGRFVKSWWPIYADDPHWVPPVIMERKAFLDPRKNPYFKVADVQCFMAYRGGKAVGTIAATVDRDLLKEEPGVGMFGFFEFIDDEAVAQGLWDAACSWLAERGIKTARGPFNFSSNHEFGLLVDGFDTDPCIANPHNRDYYGPMYERLGLHKVMDWYAYWLVNDGPVDPRFEKISARVMKRNPNIELRPADMKTFDEDIKLFWDLYNDAWERNWGHIFMSEEEFMFSAKNLKSVIDPSLVWYAFIDGELAAACVTLPDYNQVAKKMNGRIFPFGWWHFLTGRKKIDHLRVFILGVRRKFQKLPLGALLYVKIWEVGGAMGVKGAEASLILEDNVRMRGALEKLGATIYKTYRSYEYDLSS